MQLVSSVPVADATVSTPAACTPATPPSCNVPLLRVLQADSSALGDQETANLAAQATDMLLHAHAMATPDLVLALSSLAALASASTSRAKSAGPQPPGHWAASPATFTNGWNSQCPPPPVLLPLIPLLTSVAVRDDRRAEAALRRLNRRLTCPLSCAAAGSPGGATVRGSCHWIDGTDAASSIRGSCSEDGGSSTGTLGLRCSLSGTASIPREAAGRRSPLSASALAAAGLGGSEDDCTMSQSGRSAATSTSCRTGMSSLLAARQVEKQMADEQEGCRAAAARLCGRNAQQLLTQRSAAAPLALVAEAVEAEAEAVRGACLAALAAAAADVRCHQTLLGSGALDALPQLLRGPGTASYAAVLVHNLAAPPSSSFREQLRRRGVLGPLMEHLARLVAARPAKHDPLAQHDQQAPQPPSPGLLRDLTVVLTAVACLSAGQEGGEALRQPQLRAHRRLLAVRGWLSQLDTVGRRGSREGERRGQEGTESRSGRGSSSGGGGSSGRGSGGGGGPQMEAEAQAAAVAKLCALVQRLLRTVGVSEELGSPAACAAAVAVAASQSAALQSALAVPHPHQVLPVEPLPQQGFLEEAFAAGDGASLSFQSQVLVDGQPLQLTSVITRTSARRPDGSIDVRYHFEDQVSPGPAPGPSQPPGFTPGTHSASTFASPATRPPPTFASAPTRPAALGCSYRTSSTWLHAELPSAGPGPWVTGQGGSREGAARSRDARQLQDQEQRHACREPGLGLQVGGEWSPAAHSADKATPSATRLALGAASASGDRHGDLPRTPPVAGSSSQVLSPLATLAEHAGRYLTGASAATAAQRRPQGSIPT